MECNIIIRRVYGYRLATNAFRLEKKKKKKNIIIIRITLVLCQIDKKKKIVEFFRLFFLWGGGWNIWSRVVSGSFWRVFFVFLCLFNLFCAKSRYHLHLCFYGTFIEFSKGQESVGQKIICKTRAKICKKTLLFLRQFVFLNPIAGCDLKHRKAHWKLYVTIWIRKFYRCTIFLLAAPNSWIP